jgi:antitoxin PrlF
MPKPMRSTVTEKGQITIPKPIRERLGIRPGEVLEFGEHPDGGVVARKVVARSPVDELYGVLQVPGGTDELIDSLREKPDAN